MRCSAQAERGYRMRRASSSLERRGISVSASAAEPVGIGLITAFSDPFADYGKQIDGGMKAWLHQNGDTMPSIECSKGANRP